MSQPLQGHLNVDPRLDGPLRMPWAKRHLQTGAKIANPTGSHLPFVQVGLDAGARSRDGGLGGRGGGLGVRHVCRCCCCVGVKSACPVLQTPIDPKAVREKERESERDRGGRERRDDSEVVQGEGTRPDGGRR